MVAVRQVNSFTSFAMSRDSIIVGASIFLTSIVFNFISPFVARLPRVGAYLYLIYFISAFVVFVLMGMFGRSGDVRAIMQGITLGLIWNGVLSIPQVAQFRNRLEVRARR